MPQELVIAAASAVYLASWFATPLFCTVSWPLHRSGLAALFPASVVLILGGVLSGQQAVGFGVLSVILILCLESGWDSAQDIGYKGRASAIKSGLSAFVIYLGICLCLLAGLRHVLQLMDAWGNRLAQKMEVPDWLALTLSSPEWFARALATPFQFLLP